MQRKAHVRANAAYFLHCYVQKLLVRCSWPGLPVGLLHERHSPAESRFQRLVTLSASTTESWSEKEKKRPYQKVNIAEQD